LKTELTAERLRELLHYDPATGIFTRRVVVSASKALKPGDVAGGLDKSTGYWRVSVDNRRYWAHRLAWFYVHGVWPADCLDHINQTPLDNRLCNLREATKAENCQNISRPRSINKAGLLGVSLVTKTGKWQATITLGRKAKYLGKFDAPEEAHAAYLAAKVKLHPFGMGLR